MIITAIFNNFRTKSRLLLLISTHYHFNLNTKYLFTIFWEQAENFYLLPQIPTTTILIRSKSSQRQPEKRTDTLYFWPRSKVWMRAHKASIQTAATKVTNIGYRFSSRASVLNELNSKSIFCFEFIHIFCFSDYNNDIPGLEMVIWQDFDVCLVFIFDSDNV